MAVDLVDSVRMKLRKAVPSGVVQKTYTVLYK